MNPSQVEYFRHRYASMTDDELALLVATRRDVLSDDVRVALSEVLRSKDLPGFVNEVNAVVDDLNAQARAAGEELARHRENNRRARKPLLYFFAFVGLLAAVMALLSSTAP